MHADTPPADGNTAPDETAVLGNPHQIAYKVPHAAQIVDMSERQMWEFVRTGEVESFKIGTSRRIGRAALLDFIARHQEATHPPAGPSSPPPPPGPKAGYAA
jgi:hypothetical protein